MALEQTGEGKVGVYPNGGKTNLAILYNFDIDSYLLKPEHKIYLDTFAVPNIGNGGSITLLGMTSRTGDDSHNKQLSTSRTNAVLEYVKRKAPKVIVFLAIGLGESMAKIGGQKDKTENELSRGVMLATSPKPVKVEIYPKIELPRPFKQQCLVWPDTMTLNMEVKTLDILFYKKMSGWFFYHTLCQYNSWPLSVSNVGGGLSALGKPPVWPGSFTAKGTSFRYNSDLIDPLSAWSGKTISIRLYLDTISIRIKKALPQPLSTNYKPLNGSGYKISGRDITFTLTMDSGSFSLMEGIGSLGKGRETSRPCA